MESLQFSHYQPAYGKIQILYTESRATVNQKNEQGSAHVILVAVLILIITGLLGLVFWQNFIGNTATTKDQSLSSGASKQQETTSPSIVAPAEATKTGIRQSMNTGSYAGLDSYMATTVDSAIAYSDGIFTDKSGKETVVALDSYFTDYAVWNKETKVVEWKTEDFDTTSNERLKEMAAETTFFDFKGTYVAVGTGVHADKFVAFRLDDAGKITYVFYGSML